MYVYEYNMRVNEKGLEERKEWVLSELDICEGEIIDVFWCRVVLS